MSEVEGARRSDGSDEEGAATPYGVLIVDDEPAILESLELTLSSEYAVFTCETGEEALEVLVELRVRGNLLFLLWWRCEQAMRRFGPITRTVVVISLLIGYAIGNDMLVARGLMEWKYGLSAVVFPLGIYLAVSYFALDWMIEREKRKIALETSF